MKPIAVGKFIVTTKVQEKQKVVKGALSSAPAEYNEVVAIGDEVTKFKVGDWVFFPEYAEVPFVLDGKQYKMMLEEAVGVKTNA